MSFGMQYLTQQCVFRSSFVSKNDLNTIQRSHQNPKEIRNIRLRKTCRFYGKTVVTGISSLSLPYFMASTWLLGPPCTTWLGHFITQPNNQAYLAA